MVKIGSLKKSKLLSETVREGQVKWEILSYCEPVCPECNAKQGPFSLDDANLISEIKCYSCGFKLIMLRNFD